MKRCPYCGKEYSDDAAHCPLDRAPLVEVGTPSQLVDERMEAANEDPAHLTFPDHQWSARDAWKCLGMILVFVFVLGVVIAIFALGSNHLGSHWWHESGLGYFIAFILSSAVTLSTTVYFARTESLYSFWKGFGLDRKPSDYVWFGLVWLPPLA